MTPVDARPAPLQSVVAPRAGVPLRVRLVVGLVLLAAILVAPLLVTRASLGRLFEEIEQLQSQNFGASLLLGRLRAASDQVRRADDQSVGLRDSTGAPALRTGIATMRLLTDSLRTLSGSVIYAGVDTAVSELQRMSSASLAAMAQSDFDHMDTLSRVAIRPGLTRLVTEVEDAEATLRVETANRVRSARDETVQAKRVSMIALVLALIVAGIVAAWIIVSISRPVADLQYGMERVAAGQFDHKLQVASRRSDEFGRLADSYAAMAQRLGELDRLKAEFVSMASHELKTPLNVILGYLTLLDDGVYGTLTDKQREVIHTLERQSHSLNRLVRQLLDVSRYDAGGARLDVQALSSRGLFAELENSLVVIAQQRGVLFSVTTSESMPAEVWWDHDRMTEALGNLITNACKFTPRGGAVALHGDGEPGSIRIEVRDSGVGIPAPELPHVFRKFFQAGNQEATGAAGTGLGLAIVRGIVEAHGGSVHVSSEVGVGTTFTLVIPQRAPAPRRIYTSAASAAAADISSSQ